MYRVGTLVMFPSFVPHCVPPIGAAFFSVLSKASKAASYRGGVPSKAPALRAPTPR